MIFVRWLSCSAGTIGFLQIANEASQLPTLRHHTCQKPLQAVFGLEGYTETKHEQWLGDKQPKQCGEKNKGWNTHFRSISVLNRFRRSFRSRQRGLLFLELLVPFLLCVQAVERIAAFAKHILRISVGLVEWRKRHYIGNQSMNGKQNLRNSKYQTKQPW